jgi:uncharacterized membrane protein
MQADVQTDALGKNRIEALSDGVFAVAMTLLAFGFHVPVLPRMASNVLVTPALLHLWPEFLTYALSFLSLGVYWIGHHNMYHAIRRADRALLGLNIVFFLFVALLPFATSVLDTFMQTQAGLLFFGANLTIIGWLLFFQWAYVSSRPGMLASFVTPKHRNLVRIRFLIYPVVVTLTMLLCFWSVTISLAVYLLLLPLYVIPSAVRPQTLANAGGRPRPKGRKAAPPVVEEREPTQTTAGMRRRLPVALLVVAAIVLIAWAAFRPELLFINRMISEKFPAQAGAAGKPVTLLTGRFHGVAHASRGLAGVYRLPGGGRVLRLTDFQTSNGPDVRVYLIVAPDADDNAIVTDKGFVEVAHLKANRGDQNYVLASDLDIARYHAVTIWCKRFQVNFATAPLTNP